MKTASRVLLIVLLTLLPALALAEEEPCSAAGVLRDVQVSLVGHIEVSTLRVVWSSRNEAEDLSHYEIWSREGRVGEWLDAVARRGACSQTTGYAATVPYTPALLYHLEIHAVDGTVRSVPVKIR